MRDMHGQRLLQEVDISDFRICFYKTGLRSHKAYICQGSHLIEALCFLPFSFPDLCRDCPGSITDTDIPKGRSSTRRDSEIASTANFEAE